MEGANGNKHKVTTPWSQNEGNEAIILTSPHKTVSLVLTDPLITRPWAAASTLRGIFHRVEGRSIVDRLLPGLGRAIADRRGSTEKRGTNYRNEAWSVGKYTEKFIVSPYYRRKEAERYRSSFRHCFFGLRLFDNWARTPFVSSLQVPRGIFGSRTSD